MDVTRAIQIAVARADLIVCAAVWYGRIALPGLLLVGVWLLAGEVRKWRT
jgi:hypothetical protein